MIQILISCSKTRFLPQVFMGLNNQTHKPDVVILGDNTEEGLKKIPKHNFKLKVLRVPPKREWMLVDVRNNLLKVADNNKLCLTMDDDEWLHPLFVERLLELHQIFPEAILIPMLLMRKSNGFNPNHQKWRHTYMPDSKTFNWWTAFRYNPDKHKGKNPRDIMGRLNSIHASVPKYIRYDRRFADRWGFEDVDFVWQHIVRGDLMIRCIGAIAIHFEHSSKAARGGHGNKELLIKKWSQ